MRKEGLSVIIEALELEEGRLMVGERSADEGECVLRGEALTTSPLRSYCALQRIRRAYPSILRYGLHYVSAYPFGRLTVDSGYLEQEPLLRTMLPRRDKGVAHHAAFDQFDGAAGPAFGLA